MPNDASTKARHFREQANRARRLADKTAATDVADGLRRYAFKLDREAGELEEQALADAVKRQSPRGDTRHQTDQTAKPDEVRGPARPK